VNTGPNAAINRLADGQPGNFQFGTGGVVTTSTEWHRRYLSTILNAQTIATGTWTAGVAGIKNASAEDNWNARMGAWVWRPSSGTKVGTIFEPTTSFGTAFSDTVNFRGAVGTISGGAVTCLAGDVLVFELWSNDPTGTNGMTPGFSYDGKTDPVDNTIISSCASYIQAPVDINLLNFSTQYNATLIRLKSGKPPQHGVNGRYIQSMYGNASTGPFTTQQALTATLTFVSSQSHAIQKLLPNAVLSFTSTQVRGITKGLPTAVLSFTSGMSRVPGKVVNAALNFVGARPVMAISKGVSGVLSFTSAQTRAIVKGLPAATLTFLGAQSRGIAKSLSVAALSFVGSGPRMAVSKLLIPIRYPTQVLNDGAAAYWRLNEASGHFIDSSSNGFNSTSEASGIVHRVAGATTDGDAAVSMDGITRPQIKIGNNATLCGSLTTFSVEGWGKMSSPTTNHWIVCEMDGTTHGGYRMYIASTGRFFTGVRSYASNGNVDKITEMGSPVGPNYADGNWHHFVMTYDGTDIRQYIDGALSAGPTSHGLTVDSSNLNFEIGSSGNFAGAWPGSIDEIAFYSTVLSPAQINNHYLSGSQSAGILSLASNQSRVVGKGITGAVSFTSAQTRAITKGLNAATLSFIGAISKQRLLFLTASLSFVGAQTRSIQKGLSAILSFTSAQKRLTVKNFVATLTFLSAQTRAVTKSTFNATLTPAGGLTKRVGRILSGTLSFAGNLVGVFHLGTNHFVKIINANLSFTSTENRSIIHTIQAGLSFVGNHTPAIIKAFTTAFFQLVAGPRPIVLPVYDIGRSTLATNPSIVDVSTSENPTFTLDLSNYIVTRGINAFPLPLMQIIDSTSGGVVYSNNPIISGTSLLVTVPASKLIPGRQYTWSIQCSISQAKNLVVLTTLNVVN
jgi:hypothetical protein